MIEAHEWQSSRELQAQWFGECRAAAEDDRAFDGLRHGDGTRAVVDCPPIHFANCWWQMIGLYEISDGLMDRVAELDSIIPPAITFPFGRWKLSTVIVRYLLRTLELRALFGGLDGMHIAEIGCGWSGLCAVIHAVAKPASYTIYDHPDVQLVAQKYCQRACISHLRTPASPNGGGDLLISDYAFNEFGTVLQDRYAQALFPSYRCGAMMAPNFHNGEFLCTPAAFKERIVNWTGGAKVTWGPEEQHYLTMAHNYGDNRLSDAYVWRPKEM